jgi:hypothetical protein
MNNQAPISPPPLKFRRIRRNNYIMEADNNQEMTNDQIPIIKRIREESFGY